MTARPERTLHPLTVTDQYLAAILDELRGLRARLVQEPREPLPGKPRLVTEPAPDAALVVKS